jgi:hypothetical protein
VERGLQEERHATTRHVQRYVHGVRDTAGGGRAGDMAKAVAVLSQPPHVPAAHQPRDSRDVTDGLVGAATTATVRHLWYVYAPPHFSGACSVISPKEPRAAPPSLAESGFHCSSSQMSRSLALPFTAAQAGRRRKSFCTWHWPRARLMGAGCCRHTRQRPPPWCFSASASSPVRTPIRVYRWALAAVVTHGSARHHGACSGYIGAGSACLVTFRHLRCTLYHELSSHAGGAGCRGARACAEHRRPPASRPG